MNISHTQLQVCFNSPTTWVESRLRPGGQFFRLGYEQCLRLSIYRAHRDGNSDTARQHLDRLLTRSRLSNSSRIDEIIHRLEGYLSWMQDTQTTVTNYKVRLRLELGSDIFLTGEVGRVDMTPQGYRALILGPVDSLSMDELRMPLIQRAVARVTGRPEDEFTVGVQELDASNMVARNFSQAEIEEASNTAQSLAAQVASEIIRLQSS